MDLKERMVLYRSQHSISQKSLAKLCGISSQTVWSVEKGDQEPSRATRNKIECVIGGDDCYGKS